MDNALNHILDVFAFLPTPSPLLIAAWAALVAGYVAWNVLGKSSLLRSRTERALDKVLAVGEQVVQTEENPFEPELPSWAKTEARLGLALALLVAGVLAFGPGAVALALAGLGYLGPGILLDWQRKKAISSIDEDLPDLLTSLSASARISADIAALLHGAAQDLAAKGENRPLTRLLADAAARARSAGAEQALLWLEAQSPSPTLKALAFRLRVYARTGGTLADVLEESARRQRRRLEGVARARAKASSALGLANLLALMSVFAVGVIFMSPQGREFYTSQMGQIVLVVLVGVMMMGRYVIYDMVEDVR